jgi:hypothetical protein
VKVVEKKVQSKVQVLNDIELRAVKVDQDCCDGEENIDIFCQATRLFHFTRIHILYFVDVFNSIIEL